MLRYSSKDIVEIGEVHEGTSAAFIGLNTKTGKKGIYKENGCMSGISNEDIREKLASDILHTLGINCANIDLIYDEESAQNACFSNYVLSDNEQLVTPRVVYPDSTSDDIIEKYFKCYSKGVQQLDSDQSLIDACRKNYYNYAYMCCIIDSYDLKSDNLPLVYDKTTGKYKPSPWFDFGTAFKPDAIQRQSFFMEMSTDEIMQYLFKNHYEDIKDIADKVNTSLTPEKIDEIFSSDYLVEGMDKHEISKMKSRLIEQLTKAKQLEASRTEVTKETFGGIKTFFKNIKNKLATMFGKTQTLPDNTQVTNTSYTNNIPINITDNLSSLVNENIEDTHFPPRDFQPPVK